MKSVNKLCVIIINEGETDKGPNANGNTVHRFHAPAERYMVDFSEDFQLEGWEQYDTDQDAHYFGVWINKSCLCTLTYCEGDWTYVSCIGKEDFNREIRAMNDFYGEGRIAMTIDQDGTSTEYRQNREQFLIGGEV